MVGEATGPLKGVLVIELCHHLAGPTCGVMLADMGASVIKVERVPDGDDSRRSIPPAIEGESAAFMMINRNKRGVAIDLKTEAGKEALWRLIEKADVLTENYKRGVMDRLGFGYERLRERNPGLIYGRHLRLRPRRTLRRPTRLRSYRAGNERTDEHYRRAPGWTAG